ncbi:MAG TPA: hypothetical protein VK487_11945 [Candidatus Bathyarchaeia archaeon]|nr:hypothetical protein [Candidatus Bathyarchaeia archaeon]
MLGVKGAEDESHNVQCIPRGEGRTNRGQDTVSIRELRKSDLDDLLDLLSKCFAQEFEVSGFDPEHAIPLFNRAFGIKSKLFIFGLDQTFSSWLEKGMRRYLFSSVSSRALLRALSWDAWDKNRCLCLWR